MGNQNSQSITQEKINRFDTTFDFHTRVNDPRSDSLEIFTSKFSQELLSKYHKTYTHDEKMQELTSNLDKRIPISHNQILKIHGYKKVEQNDFCGGSSSCTILEEFYFPNFLEEINKRVIERVSISIYFREHLRNSIYFNWERVYSMH